MACAVVAWWRVLLVPALWGSGALAHADNWRGSLGLTSDYVHRGVSQSEGNPAVQGSLAYWHPTGWYGGAWGSNVDNWGTADLEVDLFLGYGRRLGGD